MSIWNTIVLVGIGARRHHRAAACCFAVVFDQSSFPAANIARLLVIAPFFVMPTVGALIWKNLLMHPVNGLFAWFAAPARTAARSTGSREVPMASVIIIVAWQWMPFATLILLTAMQSLDREQMEAARMDGAKGARHVLASSSLPHLLRPIRVVMMIETIFLLTVFAEILVTTSGGPGTATTNLAYLHLCRARCCSGMSAAPRPAASSPSSWPTSSPSSWCAPSPGTWRA